MCEVLDYREKRGIERDRRVLNRLNDLLLEDGRIEDLKRSTRDSDFQQKLRATSHRNYYIGTVEADPTLEQLLEQVQSGGNYEKA